MTKFVVRLISEDGPFFNVMADNFEVHRSRLKNDPFVIIFAIGAKWIFAVSYSDVYEIGSLDNNEYKELLSIR